MKELPLLFPYLIVTTTKNYTAVSYGKAKAVMAREDGEWYVFGVKPGGICSFGKTPRAALKSFKEILWEVLEDIAYECPTFKEFKEETGKLFGKQNINKVELKRWRKLRKKLRRALRGKERK